MLCLINLKILQNTSYKTIVILLQYFSKGVINIFNIIILKDEMALYLSQSK